MPVVLYFVFTHSVDRNFNYLLRARTVIRASVNNKHGAKVGLIIIIIINSSVDFAMNQNE